MNVIYQLFMVLYKVIGEKRCTGTRSGTGLTKNENGGGKK